MKMKQEDEAEQQRDYITFSPSLSFPNDAHGSPEMS